MKRFTVLDRLCVLTVLLAALLLAGCGGADPQPADSDPAQQLEPDPDDSVYVLQQAEGDLPLDGGGMPLALVTDVTGVDVAGRNAAVWRSLQSFAINFHYGVQLYTPEESGQEALVATLTEAAQGGAALVVCMGEEVAVALHTVQQEYPNVSFLLLDAEPHSADYSDYTAQSNVHSVLFHEEQAAYLAGYATVMEGYTELGVLGSFDLPEIVRSCAGFIQGAEAAAVRQGLQVKVRTWYCGQARASETIASYMTGWYNDGVQVIYAVGGALAESCIQATKAAGAGQVIAAEWDQTALDPAVLSTAAKCYNTVLQNQLYAYFMGGGYWDADSAGKTTRLGAAAHGVALPTELWRFFAFTREQYAQLYEELRSGKLSVEAYADPAVLPPTTNVTVTPLNVG